MQEGNRSQKPPPSMPPSGIVGVIASSTRSLRSLTSISVAPPTRKMRYPFDLVAHQGRRWPTDFWDASIGSGIDTGSRHRHAAQAATAQQELPT